MNRKINDLEYNCLRAEILKRIELRQNLMSISLTIAGVTMGFGMTNAQIAFVFPPIALFLAILWSQNDIRSGEIDDYLQQFEGVDTGYGWVSHYKNKKSKATNWMGLSFSVLGPGGTFFMTELMTIGIALVKFTSNRLNWGLLITDMVALLLTISLITLTQLTRRRRYLNQFASHS
jgi:hypothetical protein